jgi:hypothetical protein
VKLEGPTIVIGGGPIVVPFPATVALFPATVALFPVEAGFASVGRCCICDWGAEGTRGPDDVECSPLGGVDCVFVLYCAKARLLQLAIVTKPIAIIAEIRRVRIVL